MDEDIGKDEVVGSLMFNLKDIIENFHMNIEPQFAWKNIYGSPMNQKDTIYKEEMNENPELASNWKGRVLMQVTCEETDKPVVKVCKIDDETVQKSKICMRNRTYEIIAEIGQAIALPENKEYTIKLIIGGIVF